MTEIKQVLIMAGGTGGHVIPGLVLAKYLRGQGVEIQWLGTPQGLESSLVPQADIDLHYITISGLRRRGLGSLLAAPWVIIKAIFQSCRIMRRLKPDVVIGMGGFVSGPGGVAAWLLNRPLFIHEQNARAGLTNRILSFFSIKVLEGFSDSFSKKNKAVITTGNPVRDELSTLPPPKSRFADRSGEFRLLIVGGSLGAQALNQIVPRALLRLPTEIRPKVWHQTGAKNFTQAKKCYEQAGIEAEVMPFITNMEEAYRWADVILCRSGASTIAELCSVGIGGILVPYPYAVDDHQTANAQFMVRGGAALLIPQSELTEEVLAAYLERLARAPQERLAMAEAAYRLRRTDVAAKIFQVLKENLS